FESGGVDFSWDGSRWYLLDLNLSNRTGEVLADAMQIPGDFRAKVHSTIDPKTLAPFATGKLAEVAGELEFQQSPELQFTISGNSPKAENCEVDGEIRLGRTRFRGVPLNAATAMMRIKDKAITCEQIKVERDEGTGTGALTVDFGHHEVRL